MATPQCDTLIVPFRKYCLGFVYVSSSLRVRVWCALDVTSFVLCFCARDCKKKILVCDSCPLSLRNTGLAAARWNFLRYHVVGDSTRRHDDVSRPPATAALVLSSPSIVISMCLLLRCWGSSGFRACLLACLLPADFFISFLPSCLVESLSLLCVISPVYYNPVVSIRGLHLSSIF
jgi:hypothetical protein